MGGKSSKKKPATEPTAPLDILVEGGLVFLTSKASGKLLQVIEGKIDAQGSEGESTQFTVSKRESSDSGHIVTLKQGDQYISVTEETVELSSESSDLKIVEGEGGNVSFESGQSAGHYISVKEDGSVTSGTEVGDSTFFTVVSAVKKEESAPQQEEETPAKEEEKVEGEEEKKDEEPAETKNEESNVENQEEEQQEAPSES